MKRVGGLINRAKAGFRRNRKKGTKKIYSKNALE
jgi:hypothetical protein